MTQIYSKSLIDLFYKISLIYAPMAAFRRFNYGKVLNFAKKCKEVIAIQGRGDMTKFHSIVLEGAKFGCTD